MLYSLRVMTLLLQLPYQHMLEEENSYYSSDQQYFLDLCRAGQLQQLRQFVQGQPQGSTFDWCCISNARDNFLHMVAANNLVAIFDYLVPIVTKNAGQQRIEELLNAQNSTGNTPLHYAVITDSFQMVRKLVQAGVQTQILNDSNRTPFAQAQQFDKFAIAVDQFLAPRTKVNIEELKKQTELLDVCNEESDQDDPDVQIKEQESRVIKEEQPQIEKEEK